MAILAGVMSWVLLGAQVAEAAQQPFSADFPIPVDAFVNINSSQCTNTSTSVDLGSEFTPLKGMNIAVNFRIPSDQKTKEVTSKADLAIVKENGRFGALKQPVNGGVGGNPWILVNFTASDSNDWIVVGRCVQGSNYGLSKRFDLNAFQTGVNAAVSCGKTKSQVAVDARDQSGDTVDAWVMFANQINKTWTDANGVHHTDPADGAANTELRLLDGFDTQVRGWGAGGVGGNPLVKAAFFSTDTVNGVELRTYGTYSNEKRCKELFA